MPSRRKTLAAVHTDPQEAASVASLRYVSPGDGPGIHRIRLGKNRFTYKTTEGKPVTDQKTLDRIRSLVLPPAWQDVWISPIANGHLQAVGRDARGRRQYRYHAKWREVRDLAKYHHLTNFGHALPRIRRRVQKDLSSRGLGRQKVLATVIRLLETTLVRVGNDEYAKENGSFGLTTLRDRHVHAAGRRLKFEFAGKSGNKHCVALDDRRLARIVKQCRDIPGYHLFQYIDENGERQRIDSGDVNDYIREIAGPDFTAKDFRTWAGTVLAAVELCRFEAFRSETEAKRNIVAAIDAAAAELGNTRSVCRKNYVHPEVLDAYIEGDLTPAVMSANRTTLRGLRTAEAAVLAFLEKRLRAKANLSSSRAA